MHLTLLCLATLAAEPGRSVDFETGVIPVLTRSGCNAGACHGAAAGRGEFRLSLLGMNPAADYDAIVHDLEGRRIDHQRPARSLLLLKPTGQLEHGGETVLEERGADRLLSWIRAGAPRGGTRRLASFEVAPLRQVIAAVPSDVRLQATARYEDGSVEDVTDWTVFTPIDSASVTISPESIANIRRRGQHVVIARFLDRVVPVEFLVPLTDEPVDLSGEPRANYIDEEILRVLTELRLPVSPAASDAQYLRRVSLDLTGRLPDPAAAASFVADESADKYARLVEALLASEAFAEYWTLRLAQLLQLHSLPNEPEVVGTYSSWLRDELRRDGPFDQMARELLTATGDSHTVGPANFGRMVPDARAHAELAGRVFLGVRLGCANCHNHPLDRWTQDDYHGLAAIFAPLDRARHVRYADRGAVTNLRTREPAVPRIPGVRDLAPGGDHRAELAQWLTSGAGRRYFAAASVNRLWAAMFGRGLVEPTDDLRETNLATHPQLLQRLADDFLAHGCSLRHVLRRIALSHTYARGTAIPTNAHDDRFYSHAQNRPLMPEVFVDALADVTGVPEDYPEYPPGTRAVTLIDPLTPAPSLAILGRCSRATGCEAAASGNDLARQLHQINGDLINRKLTAKQGRLRALIAAGKSDAEIVDEWLWRALTRHPTDDELRRWCQRLAADEPDSRREALEDFAWSLLSSRLFTDNH